MEIAEQETSAFFHQYAHLVSSNCPPSEVERRDVLRHQAEIQARIAILDDEIKMSNERVPSLIAEMDILKKEDRTCSLVNAPIRRVPTDVLVEIFELLHYKGMPDPLRAPLLFCQVCRTWRNTAIHTPQLWRTLWILVQGRDIYNLSDPEASTQRIDWDARRRTLDLEDEVTYTKALNFANLWLSRAKEAPLELKVELSFSVPNMPWPVGNSLSFAKAFLKDILEKYQRFIHTLELHCTDLDSLLHDMFTYQPQFPRLSKLQLSSCQLCMWPPQPMTDGWIWIPGVLGITTFQDAKNLRTMICESEGVRPILVPSYSFLTCLIIERAMDATEWFNTFRHLTQLEIGAFFLENSFDEQIPSSTHEEPTQFGRLKHLYIYHVDVFHCAPFQQLTFPSLQDFRLSFKTRLVSPEVLYRTMPNVRHLAIRCGNNEGQGTLDHITILHHFFQDVEDFDCAVEFEQLGHLFSLLSVNPSLPPSSIMFPRMKKITVRLTSYWEEEMFPAEDLRLAIVSRWNAAQRDSGSPLVSLDIITFRIETVQERECANYDQDDLLDNLSPEDVPPFQNLVWEIKEDPDAFMSEDISDLENDCGMKLRYDRLLWIITRKKYNL